jgi:hypothetical protein
MSVNLHMLSLLRNVKTLQTLSSYTLHLTSIVLMCCDIAAYISNGLQISLISTLCLGSCSKSYNFAKINPQTTIMICSSLYNEAVVFAIIIYL